MDYRKHYKQLIFKGKNRILEGYYEKHHIIPKCMNGTDIDVNIVRLTPEEHYLAHLLLVKMYPTEPRLKYAATMMCVGNNTTIRNNKQYAWLKKQWIAVLKTKKLSDDTKKKISVAQKKRIKKNGHPRGMLGKTHSKETKLKFSEQRSGQNNGMHGKKHTEKTLEKMRNRVVTEETKKILSLSKMGNKNPNFGKSRTEATRKKIAEATRNSKIVKCVYCGKEGKISPMSRWHFDNCKFKEQTYAAK